MGVLSTAQLIRGIQNGKPIAPFSINDEVIDRYIDEVHRRKLILRSDDAATENLLRLTDSSLLFLKSDRRDVLLQRSELYCLPLPLCIAYCERLDDRTVIVVGSGLIDLIAFTIVSAHIQRLVPSVAETYHLLDYRRDMPLSELFSNVLLLFACRYFGYGEPLPNIQAVMNERVREDSHIAVSGAVTFVLLHELGHLQLGHLDEQSVHPMRYPQAIQQEMSGFQQQEIEADEFALDCLIDEAKAAGAIWHDLAMSFFSQLELVSGERSHEHPLAINRRYYSDTKRHEWGRSYDVKARPEFFQELEKRFLATERESIQKRNALIQTTREGCIKVLLAVLKALKQGGMDLSAMLQAPWSPWINRYPVQAE